MPPSYLASRTVASWLDCAIESLASSDDRFSPGDRHLDHAATLLRTIVRKSYIVREGFLSDKIHILRLDLSFIRQRQGVSPRPTRAERNTHTNNMPPEASCEQPKDHNSLANAAFSVLAIMSAICIIQHLSAAGPESLLHHPGEYSRDSNPCPFAILVGLSRHVVACGLIALVLAYWIF